MLCTVPPCSGRYECQYPCAKTQAARDGDYFYVRLMGPAIVLPDESVTEEQQQRHTFRPPLPGDYAAEATLLYTNYTAQERAWLSVGDGLGHSSPRAVRLVACMKPCDDLLSGYSRCMDACREKEGGPKLVDKTQVLGQVAWRQPALLSTDAAAPLCAETHNPDYFDGWWVNLTALCGPPAPAEDAWQRCRAGVVDCQPADGAALICAAPLAWRPRSCRLAPWRPAERRVCAGAGTASAWFCGSSTTRELEGTLAAAGDVGHRRLRASYHSPLAADCERPGRPAVLVTALCGGVAGSAMSVRGPSAEDAALCAESQAGWRNA